MDRSLSYSFIPAFVPSVKNNARVVVSNFPREYALSKHRKVRKPAQQKQSILKERLHVQGGKWQKPARKHTCPIKPLSLSVQQMSDPNRFAVLSRLTRARQATLSSMRDLRSASVGNAKLQNVNTLIHQSRRKNRKSRRNRRRVARRQMPYETRQNVCSDPPVVQVYMVTTNPEPSAQDQDEQPAEQRQRAEMPSQEATPLKSPKPSKQLNQPYQQHLLQPTLNQLTSHALSQPSRPIATWKAVRVLILSVVTKSFPASAGWSMNR